MNCCHPFTGACQQGHGCPVRATRHYTCAELGVCNCDGPDCLYADPGAAPPLQRAQSILYLIVVGAALALTVVTVAGVAGYLYATWGA